MDKPKAERWAWDLNSQQEKPSTTMYTVYDDAAQLPPDNWHVAEIGKTKNKDGSYPLVRLVADPAW